MQDIRQRLIEVFRDTQAFFEDDPQLAKAVEEGVRNARFYAADDYPALPEKRKTPVIITVTKNKTFQAAIERHFRHPRERIAVLNFASAVNPGGGVKSGSRAQEESLCRCSTLYPTLNQSYFWKKYYDVNREANDPLHTDACIWSPGVVICKSDSGIPQRMDTEGWVTVDVITCAAPNLREKTGNIHNPEMAQPVHLSWEKQYTLHLQRARHILHIAAANRVSTLILGAFGCGAFANDPGAVAAAYKEALEEYGQYFRYVEFAVYCRDHEQENYIAFRNAFVV